MTLGIACEDNEERDWQQCMLPSVTERGYENPLHTRMSRRFSEDSSDDTTNLLAFAMSHEHNSPEELTTLSTYQRHAVNDKPFDAGINGVQSTDDVVSESSASDHDLKAKVPWWSYLWDYEPGRTKAEAQFVQRLDICLLTILSLGYFIKNLDQSNISNAYVSGMKEDLHMNKNELNLIDVAWTSGYVIGQIPSQIILTKVRPSIWIPSCELVWTILTFCLAASQTSKQVIAIRFLYVSTSSASTSLIVAN